jgi:hypothetical protein
MTLEPLVMLFLFYCRNAVAPVSRPLALSIRVRSMALHSMLVYSCAVPQPQQSSSSSLVKRGQQTHAVLCRILTEI